MGVTDFLYTIRDGYGGFDSGVVTINVTNTAPVATDDTYETRSNTPLTVSVPGVLGNDTDPDGDTLTVWSVIPGDLEGSVQLQTNGSFTFTPTSGFVGVTDFAYTIRDGYGGFDSGVVTINVTPNWLRIPNVVWTPSGFHLGFDRAIDPSVLNLYDARDAGLGAPDITLIGATTGAVRGSLVLDANGQGLSFVKTGGVLAPDTYTLTVRGGAGGLRDIAGGALDGNGDGIAGDDYSRVFTVAPSSASVLSLPDFARGPGQSAVLPLRLTQTAGVTSLSFELLHDARQLVIDGAQFANGINGTLRRQDIPGGTRFEVLFDTPLPAGTSSPLSLQVSVPDGAENGAGLPKWGAISLIRGPGAAVETAVGDEFLHVSSYFMDVTGNGGYSMADVQRLSRVVNGQDTGFASFPTIDPIIVGDFNGNGQFSSLDVNRFLQFVQGQPRVEVPALPRNVQPVRFGDAVRSVGLEGSQSVSPGALVSVPLVVDGSEGLESLRATIRFDEGSLEYRGFRMTESFDYKLIRNSGGVITIDLARLNALGAGVTELLELDFAVKPTASAGAQLIDLQAVVYNDTQFSSREPNVVGRDTKDAVVSVVLPVPPAPPVQGMAAVSASSLRSAGPLALPGNVGTAVNWAEKLSAPETVSAPVPAVSPAEWKSAPWAKDLSQRLGQIETGGGETGSALKGGLLKALARLRGVK